MPFDKMGAGKMKPGTSQGHMPKAKKHKKLKAKKGVGKASGMNPSDKKFEVDKKVVDPMLSASNAKFYMC